MELNHAGEAVAAAAVMEVAADAADNFTSRAAAPAALTWTITRTPRTKISQAVVAPIRGRVGAALLTKHRLFSDFSVL